MSIAVLDDDQQVVRFPYAAVARDTTHIIFEQKASVAGNQSINQLNRRTTTLWVWILVSYLTAVGCCCCSVPKSKCGAETETPE